MDEYRLSDGRVFAVGQNVEVTIHQDGHWVPALVVDEQVGYDHVPVWISGQHLWPENFAAAGQDVLDQLAKGIWAVPPENIRSV